MQNHNRRTVLGLMASTGLTALAGCSALGGGSSLSYEDWMPERNDDYTVFAADVEAALDADVSSDAEDELGRTYFGISSDVLDVDDVGAFASAASEATVCTYTVDREEIGEELEDAEADEFDAPDAPEGYDAFGTRGMSYWLGDDYLIAARDPDLLETLYDTKQGDEDAYADTDTVSALDDKLGVDDVLIIISADDSSIRDSTGLAYGWSFESDSADFEFVVSFEDADAAEDADLSALTDSVVFDDYDDVETTVEENFVVVTGSVSISDFDLLSRDDSSSSEQRSAPSVSFSFQYEYDGDGEWNNEGGERVVIQHDGGDSVDLSTLSVRVGSTDVSESTGIESEKPESEMMQAGDQWVLRNTSADSALESGADISIIWEAPDRNTAQILAQVTVP